MKFSVEKDVLADAVSWGSRAIPQRPAMPILAGMRLSAADEQLVISAFDYETSMRAQLPVSVEEPGQALVSGRLLSDIVKSLPHGDVRFSVESGKVRVRCGNANFVLATMSLDDYPELPQFPDVSGQIDGQAFADAVSQVSFAASRDETLPLLTGVMVEIDGANMTLMATDRYRLAMREVMWHPSEPDLKTSALIRAKVLSDVAKNSAGSGDIEIAFSNPKVSGQARIVGFEVEGRNTTSTLMDGDYPPVRGLFPESTAIYTVVERDALMEATRRMRLVAERNTSVRLAFADGNLTMSAGAGDNVQATEQVPALIEGEDITTAFNPGFLMDGLNALSEPYVRMSFTHPSKPVVLTGQDELEGEDVRSYRYLLMPIRYGA